MVKPFGDFEVAVAFFESDFVITGDAGGIGVDRYVFNVRNIIKIGKTLLFIVKGGMIVFATLSFPVARENHFPIFEKNNPDAEKNTDQNDKQKVELFFH